MIHVRHLHSLRVAFAALLLGSTLAGAATSYTVVDLSGAALGSANAIAGGLASGYAGPIGQVTHATVWTASGSIDVHPAGLGGAGSRSAIQGAAAGVQVGTVSGVATSNRQLPVAWNGTVASARLLPIPFTHFGGRAIATDGVQIVGTATGLNEEDGVVGLTHALLWDAASGTAVDLGDGGNGAVAFGVGGGKQVGYVIKGNANAAVWSGTSRSLVVIHPKNAVTSVASATDGVRQVGYAGYDVRVRREAAKGNKDARVNYATLWTGTAASAVNIHPYQAVNSPTIFTQSYAAAIIGDVVVGHATDGALSTSSPAYNHAVVWNVATFEVVDLNAFLPAGFVGSIAYAVDAAGTIAGQMLDANGNRRACLWVPNP